MKQHPDIAEKLEEWSKKTTLLWRQRSSCVSFVKIARYGKHNERLYRIAANAVTSPERFAQLGCGWMLRELSLADQKGVVTFIKENHDCFSREGLRYAIEKMPKTLQAELLAFTKE